MIKVLNKLDQRLTIQLTGGKVIDLTAKGMLSLPEKELSSEHLKNLAINRSIIIQSSPAKKGEAEQKHNSNEIEPKVESKAETIKKTVPKKVEE